MDYRLSYKRIPIAEALPVVVKSGGDFKFFSKIGFRSSLSFRNFSFPSQRGAKFCGAQHFGLNRGNKRVRTVVVAAASAESSYCEFRSVDTPLELTSSAGKFLSDILQNQRHLFNVAVKEQLDELAFDRDGAVGRMNLSVGSSESCLHRRIAELKECVCQIAIEDVMYMLVVHQFSKVEVPMVPRLSRCVRNGKLAVWPSKDKEFEAIHSDELLEMVREHVRTIIGWRGRFNMTDNWTTTQIHKLQLGRVYAASILYGYFLKSAYLRHRLELSLSLTHLDLPIGRGIRIPVTELQLHGSEDHVLFGRSAETISTSLYQRLGRHVDRHENLKSYVMKFDPETLQRCARLKSREAVNLIEKHSWALFGDGNTSSLEKDEVIVVTFSSLKRLVLEAVAFGSFLWDAERFVDSVYKLKEN
ncbi:PREDICTED: UV-B-induced protein At3g17800, chloroplastic-like [Nelumbo nucifera]|uniref:UV-B-induced protein At3g17800, chloroplastic-like n=2 Tax=Nelumbo nucifera TaxID=4432 RepID=A0A822XZA8_NELNU|nr:PREDICTED: UV-B-induced protein At3g17800, chloroplastic-like [Nelumbo nucifera]DAD24145.1 TPA_asm: hypothetical protein HUJ06_025608 [Nelumbo nucifera]